MSKTRKRRRVDQGQKNTECTIGLKPFEKKYDQNLTRLERTITPRNRTMRMYKKNKFAKVLLSMFAPGKIRPQDDFYDYINYRWLESVTVKKTQKYIVQVDNFRLVQDKVYGDLRDIIVDYFTHHHDALARNLKNYYTSVLTMLTPKQSREKAMITMTQLDQMLAAKAPWRLLAFFNTDEMIGAKSPFFWSMVPDDKEPTVYRCNISPVRLDLLDINVYFDDGTEVEYKRRYRHTYFEFVRHVFRRLLGPTEAAKYRARDVFDVQVEMFNAMGCDSIVKDLAKEKTYNRVTAAEAEAKYGFDWAAFAAELGFRRTPAFFITSSLNYLKCGAELFLAKWDSPKWKTYWTYLLLAKLIRLTRGWEEITYEFRGKFERGQQAINTADAVSASLYMTLPFNHFLSRAYAAKFEKPEEMEYVRTLCDELKIVFRRILRRNTWLAPSTKRYALKKLKSFRFIYGKPNTLSEDPPLDYTLNLYDNMHSIHQWRHKQFVALEGKPTSSAEFPMVDWSNYPVKMSGTQPYIVNASYTPSKNAIYINLGYIQQPFIDLNERGIEYNLANVGFTIAHEMSHGFDDFGSQYGLDGRLLDWWTPEDKAKYKKMQADVVRQYETFARRDGINFDASIGIGEDLADISGLAICDEYLRDFQDHNKDLIPIRALSYKEFYTYFAIQQKQFISKKSINAQLKTNPHPLDKYRCNIPLSRSWIFRSLYDVKSTDDMWWHNTSTIW